MRNFARAYWLPLTASMVFAAALLVVSTVTASSNNAAAESTPPPALSSKKFERPQPKDNSKYRPDCIESAKYNEKLEICVPAKGGSAPQAKASSASGSGSGNFQQTDGNDNGGGTDTRAPRTPRIPDSSDDSPGAPPQGDSPGAQDP